MKNLPQKTSLGIYVSPLFVAPTPVQKIIWMLKPVMDGVASSKEYLPLIQDPSINLPTCDPPHVGIDASDAVAASVSCKADDRIVVDINSRPGGVGDSLIPHQTV